jgi:hypothetical protein
VNQNLFGGPHRLIGATGLVIGLSLVASPALAVEQISHTGTIGHVFAKDTHGHPGGVCTYSPPDSGGTRYMESMKLRPVTLTWPDNDASKREHGTARLRATVERFNEKGQWYAQSKSPFVTHVVYDDVKTSYPAFTLKVFLEKFDRFRAGFIIKWYGANGELSGKSRYHIEYHRIRGYPAERTWHHCFGMGSFGK